MKPREPAMMLRVPFLQDAQHGGAFVTPRLYFPVPVYTEVFAPAFLSLFPASRPRCGWQRQRDHLYTLSCFSPSHCAPTWRGDCGVGNHLIPDKLTQKLKHVYHFLSKKSIDKYRNLTKILPTEKCDYRHLRQCVIISTVGFYLIYL